MMETNNAGETQTPKSPEQPSKKQLSAEQLQKRRKRVAIPLFVLVFLAVMY
ncbi:MAG: hypothetical protein KIC70_05160 [Alistipes indistinctus]|nr:hypothetical protein [Alistipes indistinctus]